MGAQPATLQSGLVARHAEHRQRQRPARPSPPRPAAHSAPGGQQITITGTATDAGGGVVGGVEVSVDGGTTWHPATGRGSWTYNWTPTGSGLVDDPQPSGGRQRQPRDPLRRRHRHRRRADLPVLDLERLDAAGERGRAQRQRRGRAGREVPRRRSTARSPALRFYKGTTNTGTHVGHLWSRTGTMLAEATFTGETARGWQQVTSLQPGLGHRRHHLRRLLPRPGRPLRLEPHLLRQLRRSTADRCARWPKARTAATASTPTAPAAPSPTTPTCPRTTGSTWSSRPGQRSRHDPADGHRHQPGQRRNRSERRRQRHRDLQRADERRPPSRGTTFELRGPGGAPVNAAVSYDSATRTATLDPGEPAGRRARPTPPPSRAARAESRTWPATRWPTTGPGRSPRPPLPHPAGGCPCSIWRGSAVPANEAQTSDNGAVELGVKFRPQSDGQITGLRFYKGTSNTGTHVGHLWSRTGTHAGRGHLHQRDAARLAGGHPLHPGLGHARAPPTWRPTTPPSATTPGTAASSQHGRGQRAAARARRRRGRRQRRLRLRPEPLVPEQHAGRAPTTGSTWSSRAGVAVRTPRRPRSRAPCRRTTRRSVGTGTNVSATFNEPMSAATINAGTVELRGPGRHAGAVRRELRRRLAHRGARSVEPAERLDHLHRDGQGRRRGVKDRAGNALAADRTWTFTTADPPPPPPDDGPGGPILVITKSEQPVHPLLRRDPAGRGPERVPGQGHLDGHARRARRP